MQMIIPFEFEAGFITIYQFSRTHLVKIESRIKLLPWDTDFFGYRVARVDRAIVVPEDYQAVCQEFRQQDIALAYYSSPELIPFETASGDYAARLVDRKITFVKGPQKSLKSELSVRSYSEAEGISPKLIDLAVQSGVFSRFNIDPRIGRQKFEELYRTWILRSIKREIAREVLVCQEDDAITGLITLGEKDETGIIGILAVDGNCRGKGIGGRLVHAAEEWCLDAGFSKLGVVTQGNNTPACRFYEHYGFSVESAVYVYHLWKR